MSDASSLSTGAAPPPLDLYGECHPGLMFLVSNSLQPPCFTFTSTDGRDDDDVSLDEEKDSVDDEFVWPPETPQATAQATATPQATPQVTAHATAQATAHATAQATPQVTPACSDSSDSSSSSDSSEGSSSSGSVMSMVRRYVRQMFEVEHAGELEAFFAHYPSCMDKEDLTLVRSYRDRATAEQQQIYATLLQEHTHPSWKAMLDMMIVSDTRVYVIEAAERRRLLGTQTSLFEVLLAKQHRITKMVRDAYFANFCKVVQ